MLEWILRLDMTILSVLAMILIIDLEVTTHVVALLIAANTVVLVIHLVEASLLVVVTVVVHVLRVLVLYVE